MYNVTVKSVRATMLQLKSSMYYPFRQRVLAALCIHHGMRMSRIVLLPVRLLFFSTLPRKWQNFQKSYKHKMVVLFFFKSCLKYFTF